jgi:hypothetical protein
MSHWTENYLLCKKEILPIFLLSVSQRLLFGWFSGYFFLLLPLEFVRSRKKKGKSIPVTGRRGPEGYETSRLPHFLENRLTNGGYKIKLCL